MFINWLKDIIDKGSICSEYTNKINSALSKKQIVDIGLDANGISFLLEIGSKGVEVPYYCIERDFHNFINGNYVFESKPNKKGFTYTTELYCNYSDKEPINVRTTAISLLNSIARLTIKDYSCNSIYIDTNSFAEITIPDNAFCNIHLYGNASVKINGSNSKVKIKRWA